MNPVLRSNLRWIGVAVGGFVVIVILVLAFMDWNLLKRPIERAATARSGRTVTIAGALKVQIWSWTPTVTVNGLTVGNPPWESNRPMVQIERLQIQFKLLPLLRGEVILARVELIRPQLYLHQDRSGRANWSVESNAATNAPAARPAELPVVRDLLIQSGTVTVADDLRHLRLEATVQAHENASRDDPKPFRIQGQGTINEQPFALQVAGGPLVAVDPQHPYPFDLDIRAGEIHIASDGRVLKPFDLGGLDFDVTAAGNNLAELFYLTYLPLPNTPPFKLHAHVARHGLRFAVTDIAGTLGSSDLEGRMDIDTTRKRPVISADLVSNRLLMSDLAASLGGQPKGAASLESKTDGARHKHRAKAPPPDPNARLFPDAHLQVERVRAMDGEVRFRAQSVEAGTIPFKQVALQVKLGEGVLSLDPFAFEMPEGQLTGTARIDARQQIPKVHVDVRAKDIRLEQLKGKAQHVAPFDGVVQARAVIEGSGDSVHNVMSDANGTFTMVLLKGEVRSAFAELTGINVAEGIGLLLKGANDRAAVRCGVAQFAVQDGTMHAQNIVFDTQNVLITGRGDIRLEPEELDLSIEGQPKKMRLVRLRTPIKITGHLLKPSIGIEPGRTLA